MPCHGGRNPKTGQAGGLPQSVCGYAPYLQIENHVMTDCLNDMPCRAMQACQMQLQSRRSGSGR